MGVNTFLLDRRTATLLIGVSKKDSRCRALSARWLPSVPTPVWSRRIGMSRARSACSPVTQQ